MSCKQQIKNYYSALFNDHEAFVHLCGACEFEELEYCIGFKTESPSARLYIDKRIKFLKYMQRKIINFIYIKLHDGIDLAIIRSALLVSRFNKCSRYINQLCDFLESPIRTMWRTAKKERTYMEKRIFDWNLLELEPDIIQNENIETEENMMLTPAEFYRIEKAKKRKLVRRHTMRMHGLMQYAQRNLDHIPPRELKRRDIRLVLRLRAVILQLQIKRVTYQVSQTIRYKLYLIEKMYFKDQDNKEVRIAHTQMDTAHGNDDLTQSQAGNVVLTEAVVNESTTLTQPANCIDWISKVSSDVVSDYSTMTDRWLKCKDFSWDKSQLSNTLVVQLELPRDVVINDQWTSCEMPNTLPFRVHRYWRGDIEVKIQINSNKFQIGQLQCAWLYEPLLDPLVASRLNINSLSQTNHVLVSAGSSNEATLYIPYKNHLPMLHTKKRADIERALHLGILYIHVLNPLSVANGGPSKCYGAIFVRFINSKFTGQIHGSLNNESLEHAHTQMNTAVKMAMGALNALEAPNMDNPPGNRSPAYIVPTASHSWSIGNNIVEPLHQLRLQNGGQTGHPDNNEDEMTVQFVTSRYGLVETITWSDKDIAGKQLSAFNASPMLERDHYTFQQKDAPSDNKKNYLKAYIIPPIGVISSLYNYWRGSIKFRFDIVASQFHTGRLLIGYVPGASSDDDALIDIRTLLAGPHMIFNLQESQSFTYEIPYVAPTPYWPRQYQGNYVIDLVKAPSRLYLMVLNPLVPMQNVYSSVYINVYMSAGDDFELAVPVQPSTGLSFNTTVLYKSTELLFALSGQFPYYAGSFYAFLNSKYYCMRVGATSGNVAYFDGKWETGVAENAYYTYEILHPTDAPFISENNKMIGIKYALIIRYNEYFLLVPARTANGADILAKAYKRNKLNPNDWTDEEKKHLFAVTNESSNTYSTGNPAWKVVQHNIVILEDEYAFVQGENTKDVNVINSGSRLDTLQGGLNLYGENFMHLKDLLRRYQLYGSYLTNIDNSELGQCSFAMHVFPQGLVLDVGNSTNIIELSNRTRDGHIPVILSAYRYYRGGVRMRMLSPTNTDTMVWVQHRPDRKCHHDNIVPCSTVTTAEALYNHGYASYIQDTGVNAILEVEVPFYQNGAYGLLQRPRFLTTNESFYYGNGEIMVGFNASKKNKNALGNYVMTIFYSMADDFCASTFQGFPPVVLLDDIENVETAHTQMGLLDKMQNYVRGTVANGIKSEISPAIEQVTQDLNNRISQIKDNLQPDVAALTEKPLFRTILSQLAHVIANCNWKSIGVAIVTTLIEIGMLGIELMNSALTVIQKCLQYFATKITISDASGTQENPPEIAEVAQCQSEDTDDSISGYLCLLWTSICATFAVKNAKFDGCKDWFDFLTKDCTNVMRSSSFFLVFIRNTINIVSNMFNKMFGIINPEIPHLDILRDSYPEYTAWIDEIERLTDPALIAEKKYTMGFQTDVDIAYAQAIIFHSKLAITEDPKVAFSIRSAYNNIKRVKDMIVNSGSDSMVRREPFVIWQHGEAGIGKSFLCNDIATRLLKKANIQLTGAPIFVHNAMSAFWDGCVGNPVMQIDDMFNIQTGEMFERQLAMLFQVVSPVVLLPPKASLEDKGVAYNPDIVLINSNYEFINIDNVCLDAIHRRRNIIVKSVLAKNSFKIGCKHCENKVPIVDADINELSDYHHLKFYYTHDVTINPPDYKGPFTYEELISHLEKCFIANRAKSTLAYERSLRKIRELMQDDTNVNSYATRIQHYRNIQRMELDKRIEGWKNELFGEIKDRAAKVISKIKDMFLPDEANTQAPLVGKMECYNFSEEYEKTLKLAQSLDEDKIPIGVSRARNMIYNKYFEEAGVKVHLNSKYTPYISHYLDEFNELWTLWEDDKYANCKHVKSSLKSLTITKNANGHFTMLDTHLTDFLQECESPHCVVKYRLVKSIVCYIIAADQDYKLNKKAKHFHTIHPMMKPVETPRVVAQVWHAAIDGIRTVLIESILAGKKVAQFLWKHKGMILTILGLCIAVVGASCTAFVKMHNSSNDSNNQMSYNPLQWKKISFQNAAYESSVQNRIVSPTIPVAKMQGSTQQYQVVIDRLRANMFSIRAMFSDKMLTCTGLVIRGRQCLMLRHYIEEMQQLGSETSYQGYFPLRGGQTIMFAIDMTQLKITNYEQQDKDGVYNSNYCIVELPMCFPECKRITQFIANQKDHRLINGNGSIFQTNGTVYDNVVYVPENKAMLIKGMPGVVPIKLCNMYTYKLSGRGMCGNILLSNNLERPIIGMHVAGVEFGNVRGIAEPLLAEMFDTMPKPEHIYEDIIIPTMDDSEFSKLDIDANIFKLGCVDGNYVNFQSSKTQIVPSLIHGVFPIETEPNPLAKNDPRLPPNISPLIEGCRHFGNPPLDFPVSVLDNARENLRNVILQNVKPVRIPVGNLTLEESIVGNPNIDGLTALEWSTSPGFPLKFEKDARSQSGKKWLFTLEEGQNGYVLRGLHPKLKELLRFDDALRFRLYRPFTVFVDCLKDTCIPITKVSIPGKTRIFSISPIQYTIRFRQYLGEFMIAYRRARLSAEHAIGINVNGKEWTELALHLNKHGSKIIAGDYKNFGPSLMFSCVAAAIKIILDWYKSHGTSEADQNYRTILLYELISPYHLVQNLIYQTGSGIPSGSPITDILNSMVNSLYVRCVWQLITHKPMQILIDNASIVTYGDDICINISDEYADIFNTQTMADEFWKYKIIFTDADKTDNIILYRDLTTVSFLKRMFILHPIRQQEYLGALDKISVQGCANWILGRNDARIATQQNAEQCLQLAFGHGPIYYNYVKSKLEHALLELGIPFRFLSWNELDENRDIMIV